MLSGTDFFGTEPRLADWPQLGLEVSFETFLGMMNAAAEGKGAGGSSRGRRQRRRDCLAVCVSCRTECIDHVVAR